MMMQKLWIVILSLVLISCEKKELPVPPPEPGDMTITQVQMGNEYVHQLFFSLKNNEVVAQNNKFIWDLSFESADEGWRILLNSSKLMKSAFIEGQSFEDEINLGSLTWAWDANTGSLDSTAIGDWRGNDRIYLINRGYNNNGIFLGNYLMKILDVNDEHFSIQFSEMGSEEVQSAQIDKDKALSFTYFSFENDVVEVAPPKETWDLFFTQFTNVYYDLEAYDLEEPLPYLVSGPLLNRYNVRAKMEKDIDFEDIDLAYAQSQELSDINTSIGFDWKYYNLDEGEYIIKEDRCYIILDVEGFYYKLKFTGFYTDTGLKGAPKFEFQKL